eukprot:610001-Heterocapsa_arctica.AAC.2
MPGLGPSRQMGHWSASGTTGAGPSYSSPPCSGGIYSSSPSSGVAVLSGGGSPPECHARLACPAMSEMLLWTASVTWMPPMSQPPCGEVAGLRAS